MGRLADLAPWALPPLALAWFGVLLLVRSKLCWRRSHDGSLASKRNHPLDVVLPATWGTAHAERCVAALPDDGRSPALPLATVVYSACLLGVVQENQVDMVHAQVASLYEVGLLSNPRVEVHIVLSYANRKFAYNSGGVVGSNASSVFAAVMQRIRRYATAATIVYSPQNKHEFDGLHHLWTLARKSPARYYAYFHNKGLKYKPFPNTRRDSLEMGLFRENIAPWRSVLRIFEHVGAEVQTLSLTPAPGNWVWFNFFWARGTYLASLVEPVVVEDRYYYEYWLALHVNDTAPRGPDPGVGGQLHAPPCTGGYSLYACGLGNCTAGPKGWANAQETVRPMMQAIKAAR